MIKLPKHEYEKVAKPLENVTINNLFARAVIENRVSGSVYVDNIDSPETYYIVHPYGMSLLFGKHTNEEFNMHFKDYALNTAKSRKQYEWMQAFPHNWHPILEGLFEGYSIKSKEDISETANSAIQINTRVNFKFNLDKYLSFKQEKQLGDFSVIRSGKNIFSEMKGSVVPSSFWKDAEDFYTDGVGFSLYSEGKLTTTAFSSVIHRHHLELGMETLEEFRGMGFAKITCSVLIDYCLENNYEPIWACRLENTSSYRLALKLGFEPHISIPYYRLSN